LKIGLVDQLGGIKDAINYAAKKAGIKEQKIRYYPEKKEDPILELIEGLTQEEQVKIQSSYAEMPESLKFYYQQLKKLEQLKGIQMRMPYEIILN
jgi:protease-4